MLTRWGGKGVLNGGKAQLDITETNQKKKRTIVAHSVRYCRASNPQDLSPRYSNFGGNGPCPTEFYPNYIEIRSQAFLDSAKGEIRSAAYDAPSVNNTGFLGTATISATFVFFFLYI